jgi:hypothetical protein
MKSPRLAWKGFAVFVPHEGASGWNIPSQRYVLISIEKACFGRENPNQSKLSQPSLGMRCGANRGQSRDSKGKVTPKFLLAESDAIG